MGRLNVDPSMAQGMRPRQSGIHAAFPPQKTRQKKFPNNLILPLDVACLSTLPLFNKVA
jgi:hypothetical protein